jgi:hypothetical protein
MYTLHDLGTHWIGGWLGLETCVSALEKNQTFYPLRETHHDSPTYTDYITSAPNDVCNTF